jgi:hypothetical protein
MTGENMATYPTPVVALVEQPNVPEAVPAPLTVQERVRLGQLELEIERNLTGFLKCGRALLEVRESRLFRERYANFADYCRERFAIARSTADQLCRSTVVFETLNVCLAGPEAPGSSTPEIVLRPLTTLPSPELQAQTWRLAASMSPDKKPTRTIAARVTRMVKEALTPPEPAKEPKPEKDVMFVRPIQRLARIDSFRPDVACLHVQSFVQGCNIHMACAEVARRCRAVQEQLEQKFPELCQPTQ